MLRWDKLPGGPFVVGNDPRALAFDGENVWVGSRLGKSVTVLRSSDGATVATKTFLKEPLALAFDGIDVWLAADGEDLQRMRLVSSQGSLVIQATTIKAKSGPLAYDGTHIWVGSGSTNIAKVTTVVKNDPTANPVVLETNVGNTPKALAFDGTHIWVAVPNRLVKVRASDGVIVNDSNSDFSIQLSDPAALAFDGTDIWVAGTHTEFGVVQGGRAYRVRASDGLQPDLELTVAQPTAIAFDGQSLWIADASTDTVNGTSVGLDPAALVFDGTWLWVANKGSNSVSRIFVR